MRVLLDECLPRTLARELVGHEVLTVPQAGWAGLRNGDLLRRASEEFQALITIDKLLGHHQVDTPSLIVVTLKARTNRLESLRPLVPDILRNLETARPGERVNLE